MICREFALQNATADISASDATNVTVCKLGNAVLFAKLPSLSAFGGLIGNIVGVRSEE